LEKKFCFISTIRLIVILHKAKTASSLLKNSKLFSERFCGERLVLNSITRVRK
jgi:hypothetical protein